MQRLENYKSKLILFPKRDGKPKKGEINDSTADRLKSADASKQVLSKHLIEKSKVPLREKALKITKEMKDLKVYKKIKQLKVNQKWIGKREKRAKEQAEKEAAEKK